MNISFEAPRPQHIVLSACVAAVAVTAWRIAHKQPQPHIQREREHEGKAQDTRFDFLNIGAG